MKKMYFQKLFSNKLFFLDSKSFLILRYKEALSKLIPLGSVSASQPVMHHSSRIFIEKPVF
jgi:hypothetical protein